MEVEVAVDEIIKSVVLGVVQGITEFLPISSDGHLAIMHHLLGYKQGDLFFDVMLHLATLIVVLNLFGRDFFKLLFQLKSPQLEEKQQAWYIIKLVLIASVPAAIFGLLAKHEIENLSNNAAVVSVLLIINGMMLLLPKFIRITADWPLLKFTGVRAMMVGVAQAVAILPGISRSGSTITSASLLKLQPEAAARFSFYLFIPAVSGAVLLELLDLFKGSVQVDWTPLFAGFLAAMLVGFFSLKMLLKILVGGKFYRFGYYCVAIGVLSLGYFLIRGV